MHAFDRHCDPVVHGWPSRRLHVAGEPEQVDPLAQAIPHAPQLVLVLSATHWLLQHDWPVAQQPVPHAAIPDPQVRQSVPAALQAFGLVQLVVVAAAQVPLLHARADVRTAWPLITAQDCGLPQAVPLLLLLTSVHTAVPVLHEYVPFLHWLLGVQVAPWLQTLQVPPRQNMFVPPQAVPSGWSVVVALQTGAPVLHAYAPTLQGLLGVHDAPAVQGMHAWLLLQTMFVPHGLPADLLLPSVHTTRPVVQETTPFLHGLEFVVQAIPVVQARQTPPLQ